MTTGNTTLSAGSSTQTMLLSAIPEGLRRLFECAEDHPGVLYFSADEAESSLEDGTYLGSMLPSIEWWSYVVIALNFGRENEGVLAEPQFAKQRATILALMNDVLSSYAAALAETPYYQSDSPRRPAGLELIRRYQLYTSAVSDFAREMWPGIALDGLLQQA